MLLLNILQASVNTINFLMW